MLSFRAYLNDLGRGGIFTYLKYILIKPANVATQRKITLNKTTYFESAINDKMYNYKVWCLNLHK